MHRIKYGLVAGVTALSFSLASVLPAFAEPDDPDEPGGGTVLVGDPDDILDSSYTPISSVTVSPATLSLAVGERTTIAVSYNNGFSVANIKGSDTGVAFKSGDDEYTAYVGFDGEYDSEAHEFIPDYNSIYVDGNYIGSAVYTVTVTDTNGNTATTDFTVEVRDALASSWSSVEEICEEDGEAMICVLYEVGADFGTPIEGGRGIRVEIVPMTDELQALDEHLFTILDLTVFDENNETIPVSDNDISGFFGIRKEELGDLADAEELFFQIVYIKDGEIVERYDVTDIEDDGWGWMFSFAGLSHFSNYGIIVSDSPLDAPNTGEYTMVEKGSYRDNTALIITVVVMTVVLTIYNAVNYVKKNNQK
ncbi:hypothetical protein IKT18_02860 [Candidatus Saccharibacteria bacterium]|nr:hypothetical protein [Candidatus Saccharibacteria bacterium]